MNSRFLEISHYQEPKYNQLIAGDVFVSHKVSEENRIISVLSDGLGSGVKASVLATLTSSMAKNLAAKNVEVKQIAEIIMRTLPICKVRKISYSTFTIVDIEENHEVNIIEYGNPRFLLVRGNKVIDREEVIAEKILGEYKNDNLNYYSFKLLKNDRIIYFSDGITQSGMGTPNFPFGWTRDGVIAFVEKQITEIPFISAADLAKSIVLRSKTNDKFKCKDDTTCGVIYSRLPRRSLIVTGPPYDESKDSEMAKDIADFDGIKIVCGGTTAKIISRELDREVTVNIDNLDPGVPPFSTMDGVDLITEGIITIVNVRSLLQQNKTGYKNGNAAEKVVYHLLNSDIIEFIVGTKINEVHQDPNIPGDLAIRKTIVKDIIKILEDKYLKKVNVRFI